MIVCICPIVCVPTTINHFYKQYLSAECQLIAQCGHIVLQQVDQTLEERIILTLHVSVPAEKYQHNGITQNRPVSMKQIKFQSLKVYTNRLKHEAV